MKRFILFTLILFLFTGCSLNKTYTEVSYDDLDKMIDNKESFILFIGSSECGACSIYKETLNDVISEYGTSVKYIDLAKLSDTEESELVSKFPITGTPTTVFITKGEEEDTYNRINGNAKKSKIIEKFEENGYIKE